MQIKIAESGAEIARCFRVMVQLRPNLTEDTFVPRIRELQRGGYELAFLDDAGEVRAVAGFRMSDMLSRGRHIYNRFGLECKSLRVPRFPAGRSNLIIFKRLLR